MCNYVKNIITRKHFILYIYFYYIYLNNLTFFLVKKKSEKL